jgi:hypothetical protein
MSAALSSAASHTVRVGSHLLTLRDVQAGDRDAVLRLHTEVFGSAVDASWFDWKYGPALERGHEGAPCKAVGAWVGDDLIAYFGGVPRTLWQRGQRVHGLQLSDVMVRPAWRGILTRRGPFFHISKHFYDSRLGALPEHPFQLAFGFSGKVHLRLAVLVGLGWDAGAIESLHWDPLPATPAVLPWHWRWDEMLPSGPRFDAAANAAWQAMRSQSAKLLLGQRNAAYLRWRYVQRPVAPGLAPDAAVRYRFFALRRPWRATPVGLAVLDTRAASVHWLDWVGPQHLMPLVCRACRSETAKAGATELTSWASAAVAEQLKGTGIARRGECARLGIPRRAQLTEEEAPGLSWWLMGGDTDFL